MNIGTKLRTIFVAASCLNTALMVTDITGFNSPILDTIYKAASVTLNFIVVALATYFNNDYNEVAAKHTGMMRLEKAQKAGKIDGENFLDEIEDDGEIEEETEGEEGEE